MRYNSQIISEGETCVVCIPPEVLEQLNLHEGDAVTVMISHGQIKISPQKPVRQGWAEAFQAMAECGDDVLLDEELFDDLLDDEEGW
jgi:antitoxin component of MazEF toxin-antitoxin module